MHVCCVHVCMHVYVCALCVCIHMFSILDMLSREALHGEYNFRVKV